MEEKDYILISENEYYRHVDGPFALYVYFLWDNRLLYAGGSKLDPDRDNTYSLIADALQELGYLADDSPQVFFKTQEPILRDDSESGWYYVGLVVEDSSVPIFFAGLDGGSNDADGEDPQN